MRYNYYPILLRIMNALDEYGRSDLADEIEKRLKYNFTGSEILGESGLYLIQIKKTEPDIFEKIKKDYEEHFKWLTSVGLFIGIDY